MPWRQILEPPATRSEEFFVSQPTTILVEGTFGSRTVEVEMRRADGTVWSPVNVSGALVATDPAVTLGGNADTYYRVNVSAAGLSVFYNQAYPVQGG